MKKIILFILFFSVSANAATFNLGTMTMPDANVTPNLDKLKKVYPMIPGEQPLAYLKRVIKEQLVTAIRDGERIIANETPKNGDPGIDL